MKRKRLRKILCGLLVIAAMIGAAGYGYMHTAKFGAFPEGARLARIEASPNYSDGEFRNPEPIPTSTSNKAGVVTRLLRSLTAEKDRPRPDRPIPSVKTSLACLDRYEDLVIWLGHSSFYMQLAGHAILIDPVFSDNAAPVPFANEAFPGTNVYRPEDMPGIDVLLITHDHWDHLDYPTVMKLKGKIAKIVCPLGVGAHFERWGFDPSTIIELDWNESLNLKNDLRIHALPARHYSGRTLTRNKSLWAAYALTSANRKIYISGDSGYGSHFREAGEAFRGFDLAVLDSGQYNEAWRYVHMMPEDAAQAASDLNAKALLPAHAGKFSIARHSWDEPFIRLVEATKKSPFPLLTPRIGEPVELDAPTHDFREWWKDGSLTE
ncbi:MBL fold metallo-hydrolase [Desulfovibrio sp.]|uniref:MBL fold metallo-hydrolase n=1 Tax=Desulfovibrio sp. TaxID=885 RepID=UPI0025BF3D92|nr:MBL fold metallo-hydrolase [Desulfovibrio sp.]